MAHHLESVVYKQVFFSSLVTNITFNKVKSGVRTGGSRLSILKMVAAYCFIV